MKTTINTYVKKTSRDAIRIYSLSDVLREGLAARPAHVHYLTSKAAVAAVRAHVVPVEGSRLYTVTDNVSLHVGLISSNMWHMYHDYNNFRMRDVTMFTGMWMLDADGVTYTYGHAWAMAYCEEMDWMRACMREFTDADDVIIEFSDIPEYRPTVAQFEESTGYRFNKAMSGKMSGIMCASTSNLCNPFCAARKGNPNMICAACFADSTCKQYEALRENMARNTEIITTRLFKDWELPELPGPLFRFESFGDLRNVTQARNYIRMARVNPDVSCALWTKNPGFLQQAVALEGGRPDNLVTIHSSAYIDTPAPVDRFPGLFDKTFTVYRPETVAARGIDINCGARDCMTCRRCYSRDTESDVRELLK
jgi:hypothetical protein